MGISVGHSKKGLEFPVNENPGPGVYDPTEGYNYLSQTTNRTSSFGKEKRHVPFGEDVDLDIPGPIYTPTVHYLGKTHI